MKLKVRLTVKQVLLHHSSVCAMWVMYTVYRGLQRGMNELGYINMLAIIMKLWHEPSGHAPVREV